MTTSSREMFDDVVCYDEEVECNLIRLQGARDRKAWESGAGAGQIGSHKSQIQSPPSAPPPPCLRHGVCSAVSDERPSVPYFVLLSVASPGFARPARSKAIGLRDRGEGVLDVGEDVLRIFDSD
jgi:hypothetical protein